MTVRVAAIDCGTNSIRLLVADVDPAAGTLVDLDRRMEIVRLGEGVDATGRLAPESMARTFDAVRAVRRASCATSAPNGSASSRPRPRATRRTATSSSPVCSRASASSPRS